MLDKLHRTWKKAHTLPWDDLPSDRPGPLRRYIAFRWGMRYVGKIAQGQLDREDELARIESDLGL